MAGMKGTLAMAALIPLTVYVLLFYGCTFLTVFSHDIDFEPLSVADAILNHGVLSSAMRPDSRGLLSALLAPATLFGAGIMLHLFQSRGGRAIHIAVSATMSAVFVYDSVLAYSLSEEIWHTYATAHGMTCTAYSPIQALTDRNVWTIMLCAFIPYMAWVYVFNLTMTAYVRRMLDKAERDIQEQRLDIKDR